MFLVRVRLVHGRPVSLIFLNYFRTFVNLYFIFGFVFIISKKFNSSADVVFFLVRVRLVLRRPVSLICYPR